MEDGRREQTLSVSELSLAVFQSHGRISDPGNLFMKTKNLPLQREGPDLYHIPKAKDFSWPSQGFALETELDVKLCWMYPSGRTWP